MGARKIKTSNDGVLLLSEAHQHDEAYEYKAFISYSHKDGKIASSVHRQLEGFQIPKGLGIGSKSLRPIFRDRDDLSAGHGLNETLQESLRLSENLIVLCSPNAATSHWVNEEVLYFKRLGRGKNIFTVILEGEPFADDASLECLPPAIRFKLADDGTLSDIRAEPLAADFRHQGDGRKLGFLKLVSGLLGVKLDKLVRRDLAKSRRRFAAVIISSAIIISLMGSLTWFANSAQKEANARKNDAENFVEFMLSDLRDDLETVGRLDLMESIGDKAAGYYSQFDAADFAADEDSNGRRARALHLIGELKYALGATDEADIYFTKAYKITQDAAKLSPLNYDRIQEHAMSAYLQSKTHRRRENSGSEMDFLEEYDGLAKKLSELKPKRPDALVHGGTAKTNLGRLKLRTDKTTAAVEDLEAADKLFMDIMQQSPDVHITLRHAENLAWLAEAYRISELKAKAYNTGQRQVDILKAEFKRLPKDFRLLEGLIYAEIALGNGARNVKDYKAALTSHEFVLAKANEALEMEPGREKMMRAKMAALLGLMKTSLDLGDFEMSKNYRQDIKKLQAEPRVTSLKESLYWTTHLPKSLSAFDAKLDNAFKSAGL